MSRTILTRRSCGLVILLAALCYTANVACAAWWIDTPSGYQHIGGASRLGPYKTYYDAQNVNNAQFNGAGHVWGSDDQDQDPPPVWQGYAVVQILNKTSHSVRYAIRKGGSGGWTWRTIACGRSYIDWVDTPAQIQIEFDKSVASGYQRQSYNLDANVTKLRTPTGKEARKYQFVEVRGGIDLQTFSSTPYARCGSPPATATPQPRRDGAERARIERSRLERLARARRMVGEINAVRKQNQVLDHEIAKLLDEITELEVQTQNGELMQRLLAAEEAGLQGAREAWDGAAIYMGDMAAVRADTDAALAKLASEVAALRKAAGVAALPTGDAFGPPPKVALQSQEPTLEADARWEREKRASLGVLHASPVYAMEAFAGGPYASDAYLQGIDARLTQARKSLSVSRERSREVKGRRDALGGALPALNRKIATQRAHLLQGHREFQRVRSHVEDLLVDACVDAAQEAVTAHVAEWLARKIPPGLRKGVKDLSSELKAQLASVDHYLSTWQHLRAYAEIMKQHTEPGGHVPALFRAMDPALQLPGNEAFAADAEKTLEVRFRVFAEGLQEVGLPAEAQSWAELYAKVFTVEGD